MAMGVSVVALWRYTSVSLSVQTFASYISRWLLCSGAALFLLGTFCVVSAYRWSRCCLFFFAWLALVAGATILAAGTVLFVQPGSDAAQIERLCEMAPSGSVLGKLGAPKNIVAAQNSYDSMLDALAACRAKNKMAIRLDACPDITDSAERPWITNPHRQLFRQAEDSFSCSGFCKDAAPLFGLPRGSVNLANRGRPRHACFSPIAAELRNRGMLAACMLLTAGVMLLGPAVCACWLACAPPPVRRSGYVHHAQELEWTAVAQDSDGEDAAWD